MKSIILLAVGLAIGAGAVGAYMVHPPSQREPFQAKDITGVPWGKGFELNDAAGGRRTLADFRGRVVLLSFGYTSCPDVCPTTFALIGEAVKKLGPDARRIQTLFVTLDPQRDTPERLARYVASFDPSAIALYADAEGTQRVTREFKIHYHAHLEAADTTYEVDHSAQIYLFDPAGHLRLLVNPGASAPAALAQDMRLLLRGPTWRGLITLEDDQPKAM